MTKQEKLDWLNSRGGYNAHNGIVITDVEDDSCVVETELRPEALNPLGMAHGGLVFSLCDVAAGVLVAQTGQKGVTTSSSMSYLHPSYGSRLRAEGKVLKSGRTITVIEASVYDERGVLTARGTFELCKLK